MATPLFFKAWQLNNLVYDTLLRYPFPIRMIPDLEKFILQKYCKKVSVSLSILVVVLLLYVNLFAQAVIFRSVKLKTYIILINIAMCGATALCLVLSGILLPCAHTLMIQFLNALIQSNKRLVELYGHKCVKYVEDNSTLHLLKKGSKQYKKLHKNLAY